MSIPEGPEINWSYYEVSVTDVGQTGIRLFKVVDPQTQYMVYFAEFNPDFDIHSALAWAAARTSRSSKDYEEIFSEIVAAAETGRATSGDKLATFFKQYGHSSVAGMAPVFIFMNGIPIFLPFYVFNHLSVGDGQELSTRYVKLEQLGIPPLSDLLDLTGLDPENQTFLSESWIHLQEYLVNCYHKWYPLIEGAYAQQFSTEEGALSASTLTARTLDIVRMFIPAGSRTSMALLGSVRAFLDIIMQLREYGIPQAATLAEQLNAALNLQAHPNAEINNIQADLDGLTGYGHARMTVSTNLVRLDELLSTLPGFQQLLNSNVRSDEYGHDSQVHPLKTDNPGLFTAMQYILSLYPNLSEAALLTWLNSLSVEDKITIGDIIFAGHTHHDLMRNAGDIRGLIFSLETSLAYARDLNRHRAHGRLAPILETKNFLAILEMGFNDNFQLQHTEGLKPLRSEFNDDLATFYLALESFYLELRRRLGDFDERFLLNVLPLGHQVKLQMSAPVTQMLYMLSQRLAPGGDIGYRHVMQQVLEHIRASSPFFQGMLAAYEYTEVDPNSPQQFKSRK